jgi:hypothetical protein
MIVRGAPSGVHLIPQPDHAQLARRIMEHWPLLGGHPRRESILRAIAEHDNGWAEEDTQPTLNPETGRLEDFVSAPFDVRQRVWPRGVRRVADPWAAALIAHHAVFVYERFRSDANWAAFFSQMETLSADKARASNRSMDDLLADYPFLRLGDLISLAFCTGSTDRQRYAGWTVRLAGSRVIVEPDAFDGVVVPIEIAARRIPTSTFESATQLRRAVRDAPYDILRGDVGGAER